MSRSLSSRLERLEVRHGARRGIPVERMSLAEIDAEFHEIHRRKYPDGIDDALAETLARGILASAPSVDLIPSGCSASRRATSARSSIT